MPLGILARIWLELPSVIPKSSRMSVLDFVAQDGDLKAKHFFALSVFEGDLFGLDASSMTFKAEEYLIDAADEGFPPSVAYVEERRHHREIQMVGLSSFSLNSSSSSSSVGFSSNLSLLSQSPDLYCNYLHEEVELESSRNRSQISWAVSRMTLRS